MERFPADAVARPGSLDAVLDYAWDAGEFTATDVMDAVGVTRSTAISAIERLVDIGLLQELPNARDAGEYRMGRPARRFELRAAAGVTVGVDAGRAHLAVEVADLAGSKIHTRRWSLDPDDDSTLTRRRLISDAVDSALEGAGSSRDQVVAVCVGVPAPVDKHGSSPHHRAGFWDLMNPDLVGLFAGWAPFVRVENDASLAALAEGTSGAARGCDNYVTLLAGDRLGAGVVVDGQLLRGAHGGVGEMLAFAHVVGVETASGLGQQLQDWARDDVRAGTAAPTGRLAATPIDAIDARLVVELAAAGDGDAQALVARAGSMLARVLSVLGSMFDPQRIVVSGAVAGGVGVIADIARAELPTGIDLPVPELSISSLGADVVVEGAVAGATRLARENALELFLAREVSRRA